MTCSYCGSRNGEGEHRCRRCGRRPGDTLTSDFSPIHTDGALATKLQPIARVADPVVAPARRPAADLARAVQGSLFQERSNAKVVPIASYAPPVRSRSKADPNTTANGRTNAPKPSTRRTPRVPEGQGSLDFLPPAPPKPRTLGTTVEAVIYCEAPVATTLHRAVAAALDWAMVLIGYGVFLLMFHLMGGAITLTKGNVMMFGGMLLLIGFAYGLTFAIAGTETAGMYWTQLRLTTFDGFPPENKHRLLRFAGSCLSICTVVGLLWSLADEESLTWQDHISRTFPTPKDLDSQIFQRR
jgi:uncharacterized RDD family membrane protein YckC